MVMILSLDSHGNPMNWVSLEEAICYHVKDLVAWQAGEEHFMMTGGISRMTGKPSFASSKSIIAIKQRMEFKKTRLIPTLSNVSLFKRDRNLCAYCGKKFPDSALTRDHIVPRSKGGKNSWMNCVTACKRCNNRKDDKLLSEMRMELLYLPYTPSIAEHLIMVNRKILADQMEFLLQYVPEKSRLRLQ